MTTPPRYSGITAAEAARELAARQLAAKRMAWRESPAMFAREALGIQLWEAQVDVAANVARHPKTSWRASQKIGKSTLFAVLALWRFYCFDRALVVLSSGNLTQVKVVLWRELRRLYFGALIPIGPRPALDPATGLVHDDGRAIIGLTVRDAERMGGYSSPDLLVLLDEASGIDDSIIEAALGNLAGGGAILLAGNPTRNVGFFARTHRESLDGWQLHHTSTFDSPNVKAGRVVVPGLALPSFPESMAADFGIDSAAYQVRVLGEYATQASDAVIPLITLTAATATWDEMGSSVVTDAPLEVGVDPARYGDDETVIQGRIGNHAFASQPHRKLDNVEVAARAADYVNARRLPGQRVIVRVDEGGLGAGVYDHLRRAFATDSLVTVQGVNAASRSEFPYRFSNARAQLWWALRMWLQRGGTLPPDQRRDAELLAATYTHDTKLRVIVASKDDMKKKLRRSPDRADALALACFSESPLSDGESLGAPLTYLPPNASRSHPVLGPRRNPWGGERPSLSRTRDREQDISKRIK